MLEMKNSGINWIGNIPKNWRVMPIKYLKANEDRAFVDGPFGSNLKSEHFVEDGDVYVIESGCISTGKFIFKNFKTITNEHFLTIMVWRRNCHCWIKDRLFQGTLSS